MTFFYDLNKKLADITTQQKSIINEDRTVAVEHDPYTYDEIYGKKGMAEGLNLGPDHDEPVQIGDYPYIVATYIFEKFPKLSKKDIDEVKKLGYEFAVKMAMGNQKMVNYFWPDAEEDVVRAYFHIQKYPNQGLELEEQGMAEGKGDGNLANNARPYNKITRGDVIAGRLGKDEMGGKEQVAQEAQVRKGKKGDIATTATGVIHTQRYDVKTGEVPDDEEATGPGRPTGPKHTYDAPFGTIEVPAWKGPSTVHKISDVEPGKEEVKRGRPKKVKEELDDEMIHPADRGEYDREGDMAKTQLSTAEDAANELRSILDSEENLPEWVQSKIAKAVDYLDTARDYMVSKKDQEEPLEEKAVSGAQQQAAAIALKAKREGHRPKKGTASSEMMGMSTAELEKFAKTKRKGLPKHVEKKVDETTTSGSVAVSDGENKPKGKAKGVSFGKGIYDSWNRELENIISESLTVTVTQNRTETGEIEKSINISATDDDAERIAELLNLAGMHGDHDHSEDHTCPVCGQEPCGCAEMVDENKPDWPTNTEYNDDALQYSGGLNRPKSTGQTTVPVIASQLDRQMSEDDELAQLKKMLG